MEEKTARLVEQVIVEKATFYRLTNRWQWKIITITNVLGIDWY